MQGARGLEPKFCVDGNLSVNTIIEAFPSLQLPLVTGLPFQVIRHVVEVKIPGIAHFLSEAGNQTHGA